MRKSFLAVFVVLLALIGYILWRAGFAPARRTVDPEQVQGTFDNPSAPSVLASRTRARELAPTTGTNIPTIPAPEIMVGTNFGYSNGVYFQNVVTQIVLPQPPPDYEAWRRDLQEWKERNALLGIDQDIAKREAELKERAKLLAIGMTRNR